MHNVGVITNAFREEPRIAECIRQFNSFQLDHLVLCPQFSWNGGLENDDTYKVAQRENAVAVRGNWKLEAAQLNFGLSHFRDKDWVIICDADERYRHEDIILLLNELDRVDSSFNSVRTNQWEVYWKTKEYVIRPEQTYYPLIAVRPKEAAFRYARALDYENSTTISVPMHHFSYVRTDEEMWDKINAFSHASEFDLEYWYNNVWKIWEPRMRNLHPVVPEQFEETIHQPAPEGIRLD